MLLLGHTYYAQFILFGQYLRRLIALDKASFTQSDESIELFRYSASKQLKTKYKTRCRRHFHRTKWGENIFNWQIIHRDPAYLSRSKTASN